MPATVIDISHHNRVADLPAAVANGVIGVIHKATEGMTNVDSDVDNRWPWAKQTGCLWGLYHFLRPVSMDGQIKNFLEAAKKYGDENTMLAADHEDPGVSLDMLQYFLEKVEAATGRVPVIYSGHVLKEQLGSKRHPVINGDKYRLWLAQYSTNPVLPVGFREYWLWQYTDKGTVTGVVPPTDLNRVGPNFSSGAWAGRKVSPPRVDAETGGVNVGFGIGEAVKNLQMGTGVRVARAGWNGKGMYLLYVEGVGDNLPFVMMKTADGKYVPWLCSQTDLLAKDWQIVK